MAKSTQLEIPQRLFEIGAELESIFRQVDETGEIPAELDEYIQRLDIAERSKAGNVLALIQRAEAEATAAKQFRDYFDRKFKSREQLVERLEQFIKNYLAMAKRESIETDRGLTFKLERAGGKKPLKYHGARTSELIVKKGIDDRYTATINGREVEVHEKYINSETRHWIDGQFVRELIERHPDSPPPGFSLDDTVRVLRRR